MPMISGIAAAPSIDRRRAGNRPNTAMATTHEQPQSRPTSTPTPTTPFNENRDLYRQKYEAQLREWEAKVEEMKARADKLDAQARLSMRPHFDGIENSMKA